VALVIAIAIAGTGCSGLTKVSAPDITSPGSFENPAGAITRQIGAIAQFYIDLSQWAYQGGKVADEFTYSTPTGDNVDLRVLPDGGSTSSTSFSGGSYPGPQTRVNALIAIALLQRYGPVPSSRIGELFAALGSIETVMAEGMCSGVPLATVVNGVPVAGTPTTTTQLYAHALAQFDSAARYAADSASILNFALVGRARALLDLDSAAAAARVATAVPTGYAYQARYSATTTAQENMIALVLAPAASLTVSDREGGNGLDFVSAKDPRVPTDLVGLGTDGVTPHYTFVPYTSPGAPIPLASGIEARLIEAEAALASGDAATWLADLNALRADSAETHVMGLGPIADPVIPASRVDTMFTERAFWLFATGHRQGDLRRLIRQYGRTQAQVFPVGLYKNTGEQYGSEVTFPVAGDKSNPSAPECLDRNP
jgi:hypothetical protein